MHTERRWVFTVQGVGLSDGRRESRPHRQAGIPALHGRRAPAPQIPRLDNVWLMELMTCVSLGWEFSKFRADERKPSSERSSSC